MVVLEVLLFYIIIHSTVAYCCSYRLVGFVGATVIAVIFYAHIGVMLALRFALQ